ncbi:MAG: hypothetical protein R3195_15805 [Gemmatimonadota bacterium]|nr:hypothetical protein [Gemmatimonadota bacterium]
MDELAPMLVAMTLILTSGAVLLLRPVAKRLGDLLELMAKQRTGEIQAPGTERLSQLIEALDSRLGLVEERLDFTDRLLQERREESAPLIARPENEDTTE